MKAIVQRRYGGPETLNLEDINCPSPGRGEILVRVRAASVTSSEARMRQGLPWFGRPILGLLGPRRKVLGLEFSGTVAALGPGTSRFGVGERVFGFTGFRCGAWAEFLVVPEDGSVERIPRGTGYEEAVALVDGPTTALLFLEQARVRPGEKILVNGASGSVGSAAVQLAVWKGAEVTAVCSEANHELVRSLGARWAIDYHAEDFTRRREAWDVVFDAVGTSSFGRCRACLRPSGRYLSTVLGWGILARVALSRFLPGRKAIFAMSIDKRRELARLRDLVELGLHEPVVDRTFSLEEMQAAHAYVDTGRKKGNVVVRMDGEVA